MFVDPTGNYLESALDVAFISYDINELRKDQSLTNYIALGADLACLALPVATGGGAGVRGLGKLLGKFGKADDPGKITKSFKWLEDNITKGPVKRKVTNYVMEKGAKTTDDFRDAGGVLNKKLRAHYNKSLKSQAEYYGEMAGMAVETSIWGVGASATMQYLNTGEISGEKLLFDTISYGVFGGLLGGAKPLTSGLGKGWGTVATNLLYIPSAVMQGAYRWTECRRNSY